jgi:hypothetical protein
MSFWFELVFWVHQATGMLSTTLKQHVSLEGGPMCSSVCHHINLTTNYHVFRFSIWQFFFHFTLRTSDDSTILVFKFKIYEKFCNFQLAPTTTYYDLNFRYF